MGRLRGPVDTTIIKRNLIRYQGWVGDSRNTRLSRPRTRPTLEEGSKETD